MESDNVGRGRAIWHPGEGLDEAATIIDQAPNTPSHLGDYFVESWAHLGGEVVSEDTYLLGDMTASAQAQRITTGRGAGRYFHFGKYAGLWRDH